MDNPGGGARHCTSTSITFYISCKLIVQTKLIRAPVTVCLVPAVGDDSALCSLDFLLHCASRPESERDVGLTGCSA